MNKVIKSLIFPLSILAIASCNSVTEKDVIGKWYIDAGSIEVELGEKFPIEAQKEIERGLSERKSFIAQKKMNEYPFDFQEGGRLFISLEGKKVKHEAKWSVEDDKLIIEGEFKQLTGKIALKIDIKDDVMNLTITGEELLNQIADQQPAYLLLLKSMSEGKELSEIAKGISIKFSLKK